MKLDKDILLIGGGSLISGALLLSLGTPTIIAGVVSCISFAVGTGIVSTTKQIKEITGEIQKATVELEEINILQEAAKSLVRCISIARKIENENIKNRLFPIFSISSKILQNVKENPKDYTKSYKFVKHYIPSFHTILEKYYYLQEKNMDIASVNSVVEKTDKALQEIEKAFKDELEKVLQDDVLDLKVELQMLRKAY